MASAEHLAPVGHQHEFVDSDRFHQLGHLQAEAKHSAGQIVRPEADQRTVEHGVVIAVESQPIWQRRYFAL